MSTSPANDLAAAAEDDADLADLGDSLRDAVETVAQAFCDAPPWLSTGLKELDEKIGGLHASDLIVIAGRPTMGKTALALGIAAHVARREPPPSLAGDGEGPALAPRPLGHVAFFSPQMTSEQLALRLCAMEGKLTAERLYKGNIDAEEFGRVRDAAMELQDTRLYIDDRPALTIDQIEKRAQRVKQERGLDLIVVDCIQQVVGPAWTRDNRTHELGEIVRRLKALAKALKVPVVAVSNLNRQVEDRRDHRPWLTDLRHCGEIEDIADLVIFTYRRAVDLLREEPREGTPEHLTWQEAMDVAFRYVDLILAKNRHGSNGTRRMKFDEDTIQISDLPRHEYRFDRTSSGE
jgi:replicative DNA helicase